MERSKVWLLIKDIVSNGDSRRKDNKRVVESCYVRILKESGHGREWKIGGSGARLADSY